MNAKLIIKDGQHWFEVDREEYNRAYEAAVMRHYFPAPKAPPVWRRLVNWLRTICGNFS